MTELKKLADVLKGASGAESLNRQWNNTEAATEYAPLPSGEYTFRITKGELSTARNGTPGYKLTLEVTEGEHAGRRVWHDLWLTSAAMSFTKRDLAKIGVASLEQLERPLPQGILVKGKLAVRKDDDGTERNRLVRFEAAGIAKPHPFAAENVTEGDSK